MSLFETLTLLALNLMEIGMVEGPGQNLCFSTQLFHEVPWCFSHESVSHHLVLCCGVEKRRPPHHLAPISLIGRYIQ